MPMALASWVIADARQQRRPLCYDYGTFIYFAWPILIPHYLFKTRGVRALLTLIYFAFIALTGGAISYAISRY